MRHTLPPETEKVPEIQQTVREKTVDEMISKALAKKEDMAKTVVDNWRDFF